MTEAEIEAAARALCDYGYGAGTFDGLSDTCLETGHAKKVRAAYSNQARAALAAAEAARKPDLVPGLERAREIVGGIKWLDHAYDTGWTIGFGMGRDTAIRAITAEIAKATEAETKPE